jgi:hypothetical protein
MRTLAIVCAALAGLRRIEEPSAREKRMLDVRRRQFIVGLGAGGRF